MSKRKCFMGWTVIAVLFFAVSWCVAAELSSREIKMIEEGLKKIKSDAKGIQKEGFTQLRDIGIVTAPYLIEVLEDKAVSNESKALICDLLGELKAREATTALTHSLKNQTYTVRAAACKAMGKIADPAMLSSLLDMLGDEEPRVRETASYALASFSGDIAPKIAQLLNDSEEFVRVAAMTVLNAQLDPRTAPTIREALQKDKSNEVRKIAAKASGRLKDKGAVEVLTYTLTEDTDHFVREECAVALGKIADSAAVPYLIKALKDDYKDVQLQAAFSLKGLTGQNFERDHEKWSGWYESQKK